MSMNRPRYNMGRIDWIGAEALGVPGSRTFRLLVMSGETAAQLWLEKEQLQALAEAIARMLIGIDSEKGADYKPGSEPAGIPRPPNFPASPDIELYVGTLGLRYDPQRDLIALEAYERVPPDVELAEGESAEGESAESEAPTFRCLTSRRQMEGLQATSLEVVAAGRPRCPLCGTPLTNAGMPHFCPQTNGHQKLTEDSE
jgi:uncharacterized repeat protein (TIGR03847 family)